MVDISDLLILEVEQAVLKGSKNDLSRSGIVEGAYGRLLREHVETMTESDRANLHVAKLLLEYEYPFMREQREVVLNMLDHSVVKKWAKRKGLEWDEMDESDQGNAIFSALVSGALKEARNVMNKHYDLIKGSPNTYDIPDSKPKRKVDAEIEKIFLNALRDDK